MPIKLIYLGFSDNYDISKDDLYLNVFNDNKYIITSKNIDSLSITSIEQVCVANDIIICGCFLYTSELIKILFNYRHKIICYITKPIEFTNTIIYHLYTQNIIPLSVGCVIENDINIKYPRYIDSQYSIDMNNIIEINNYIKNLTYKDITNKNFCCLINSHDLGNTRMNLYNKLNSLGHIVCPSILNNNFDPRIFEQIGRETFQKHFIFCLCGESYITELEGYVTEKLFIACCCGNIPIYCGKLDSIDKKIFNINRIIFYDPNSIDSLNYAYEFIKELLTDKDKLYTYYTQNIFLEGASNILNTFKLNLKFRLDNHINNIILSQSREQNNLDLYKLHLSQNELNISPSNLRTSQCIEYEDIICFEEYTKSGLNLPSLITLNDNLISKRDYIISLVTTNKNLKTNEFKILIDKLTNQIIKPKYILVKVELTEDITPYTIINNNYPDLIINCYQSKLYNISINSGYTYDIHMSNLENILNLSDKIDINDKIIFINDTFDPDNNFILMYELGYQLYNCDGIAVHSNDHKYLFWDNFQNEINIAESYSFKYNYIKNIKIDSLIENQLDKVLYTYYINNDLYMCGMHLKKSLVLLSKTCLNTPDKGYSQISFNKKEDFKFNPKLKLAPVIEPRYVLYNVKDLVYNLDINCIDSPHIDIKYYNSNIIIITITHFNNEETHQLTNNTISFGDHIINYVYDYQHPKISLLLFINTPITYIPYTKYEFDIFQTDDTNTINLKKFYSLMTILNYIPNVKYKFFTLNDITDIMMQRQNLSNNNESCLYYLYAKINSITTKIDLFRAWYLYNNGGLYLNIKSLLHKPIADLLELDEFYTLSLKNDIYPNTIFIKNPFNENIKIYLVNICYNIFISFYGSNYLTITNSELLEKIISPNYCQLKMIINNNNNIITLHNNQVIITNYKSENATSNMLVAFDLWRKKQLFKEIPPTYGKINGIDHIVWINLDRCIERKKQMENLLNNLDIPNTRISGIDGKLNDLTSLQYLERPLSNDEKAVTLSHIKAINYLKSQDGSYFLICEDDIDIKNINLFDYDLKHIINQAPEFDILLISKIYDKKLEDKYTKWNDTIYGAMCYVISRNGIEKLTSFAQYDFNLNSFNITYPLSIADWFLYHNTNTYVFKYNYISSLDEDSLIHPEHINIHKISSLVQLQSIIENCISNI
mgnify:CR=1 FL=1